MVVDLKIQESVHKTRDKEQSQIQKFYAGKTVFVTGGSGYIGSLIIEKLLRTCKDVKRIYILMREKKGKTIQQRLQDLTEYPSYSCLKQDESEFLNKCVPISGDCTLSTLGLIDQDREKLINEVNCVFHCAATVRFDEAIRVATNINVRATRDILRLSKEIKNLKSFVYVSTAFSHCVNKNINEEFYETLIDGENLIQLVNLLSESTLNSITTPLIGKWPNTYVFTKSVAENIVRDEGKSLPIVVVRPSIIVATANEPVPGFIDNLYGVTGVLLGVATGLIRTLHCKVDNLADMVPADFVVNCTLAAAWEVGTKQNNVVENQPIFDELKDVTEEEKDKNEIPIYNYICSAENPINWRSYMNFALKECLKIPSPLAIWHHCYFSAPTKFIYGILEIALHKVPAYIIDFFARCFGKEPQLVKGYKKIEKLCHVLSYFSSQQWNFSNENTQGLWKKLNFEDQKLFNFNMKTIDWETYFHSYVRGCRVYLLKDPMETVPQGKVKYLKLQVAHYSLVTILGLILFKLFLLIFNAF